MAVRRSSCQSSRVVVQSGLRGSTHARLGLKVVVHGIVEGVPSASRNVDESGLRIERHRRPVVSAAASRRYRLGSFPYITSGLMMGRPVF